MYSTCFLFSDLVCIRIHKLIAWVGEIWSNTSDEDHNYKFFRLAVRENIPSGYNV